ncbi:RNA polymerase sigma factor [Marixanthomonas ophiurae]|uniref:Sigma-70 family RNA polymerase sigma factor n=1 Tax=Marixanthomonas ophiurae TaxID=387659 RepID=A0A3E1QCD0_9FLAO|nr:sigma-70 family RNA polymerase sigma factor [Marixanthomonas ophiurae]RFN59809.1 sigma-70 family RNA polymerase sigma factor [Marixanthomonas ophiurae]
MNTEEKLIERCKKRDRAAQSELFEKYKNTLYFLSLKYCRNEADAEDNTQDAFITIFEKIKSYKGKGSFEGWMKRITIYKAIAKYKIKKTTAVDYKNALLEDTTIEENKMNFPLETLLNMVQKLPDQYRLVFNLYQLDGFSHKEVANLLAISESTSKSNYHRAKQLLKNDILKLKNNPKITNNGA